MPDISQLNQLGMGMGNGSMATNLIFGDNRKRSIEVIDDDWTSPSTEMSNGRTPQLQQQQQMQQGGPGSGGEEQREAKRMKGQ
jgi:hypothetical protein